MKIYIANKSKQAIGGGWTFIDNLKKAIPDNVTDNYDEADIYFITSATMIQREDAQKAKDDGKKIVLRVDNAVRNSRNRNTGMSRMKDFAKMSDLIVYQSKWAKDYLSPFLGKGRKHKIILNSTDESLFNIVVPPDSRDQTFLDSRYNRDETKNWEMARYIYSMLGKKNTKLYIVGQFSPELRDGNFDFYSNEVYEYLGVLDAPAMSKIYNISRFLIFTYYNDACSNTLIEASMCGCRILDPYRMLETGGSSEIYNRFKTDGVEYFYLKRMGDEYKQALSKL